MVIRRIDLTGQRFGRLVVLRYVGKFKNRTAKWECRCDCGNYVTVRSTNLRNKNTQSCGCYRRDMIKKAVTKHGDYETKLYDIWTTMNQRCSNSNANGYHRYGGRGINVIDRWQEFIPFRDWSLIHGYEEGLSIDRINNDGNYEPGNCQWITVSENSKKQKSDRIKKAMKHIGLDEIYNDLFIYLEK